MDDGHHDHLDLHGHEKESSSVSGSLGNSGTDSPPVSGGGATVVPQQIMNMAVNMSMERNFSAAAGAATLTSPPLPQPPSGEKSSSASADLLTKKKRGRPRKYDSDGNLRASYAISSPSQPSFPPGFTISPPSYEFSSSRRGRGRCRPSGSGNWQLLASLGEIFADTAGGDFTPHVVTVSTGEDVAGKIVSLGQRGPRGICILSANGAVSNVTIRQPGSSGGILTYEDDSDPNQTKYCTSCASSRGGRFELLSLTGSFTVSDIGGIKSRSGGLSVSLAGPDGRVIGGAVAGSLLAASPIQMVVGSFTPNGYKVHKRKQHRESPMASVTPPTITSEATPISQATPVGETYQSPRSPLPVQSHGSDETKHQVPNVAASYVNSWNGSNSIPGQRPYPDINVSIHAE